MLDPVEVSVTDEQTVLENRSVEPGESPSCQGITGNMTDCSLATSVAATATPQASVPKPRVVFSKPLAAPNDVVDALFEEKQPLTSDNPWVPRILNTIGNSIQS